MLYYFGHTKHNCTSVMVGQELIGEVRRAFAKYHAYPNDPRAYNGVESIGKFDSLPEAANALVAYKQLEAALT